VRRLDLAVGTNRIWQERPDRERWLRGLAGAELPLLQLPLLLTLARQRRRVLIVEGEKACDALERIGLFATTNAGGAGKWKPNHTASLSGATVVAICDSDLPGRLHAAEVTASAVAAEVDARMPLDLFELGNDSSDIVDWLAAVAAAARTVNPGLPSDELRARLRRKLEHELARQLPATTRELQTFVERARYLYDPDGKTYLTCARCERERPLRASHGLAFCPCGAHQEAPR
jgi:hypothetical protein